ncbi:hypothetical protein VX037_09395 [Gordonia sp. Z-3]|uniref:hypothetical protein n=1 Tax=Gordonia sp. Z-3 TaxID=3115408 RepID=UPI002E2B2635|nr:hypothetical protein [Gordonia sp. Z-3]MED5801236.1 hypothetical protein [Gordonia sp. Z-3]
MKTSVVGMALTGQVRNTGTAAEPNCWSNASLELQKEQVVGAEQMVGGHRPGGLVREAQFLDTLRAWTYHESLRPF